MPCYEPPRPDVHDYHEMMRQRDKYVDTLKEVEDQCKRMRGLPMPPSGTVLAQIILDIIDSHWR